jgi:hypothetical protein
MFDSARFFIPKTKNSRLICKGMIQSVVLKISTQFPVAIRIRSRGGAVYSYCILGEFAAMFQRFKNVVKCS